MNSLTVERYKSYEDPCTIELRPLTVLLGANNSGKTALARALPLIAGALSHIGEGVIIPLHSFEIVHGSAFNDLITHRSIHGKLRFGLTFDVDGEQGALDTTVQNVVAPGRAPSQVVTHWQLTAPGRRIEAHRRDIDDGDYQITYRSPDGDVSETADVDWNGLLPSIWLEGQGAKPGRLADHGGEQLYEWARHLRYLASPRKLETAGMRLKRGFSPNPQLALGLDGRRAAQVLMLNPDLFDEVKRWFDEALGVRLELREDGSAQHLEIAATLGSGVSVEQAGQGISQVLPVAVMGFTADRQQAGVDIIEHPEAELHPGAHAAVAQLLIDNLPGARRPLVVETHSEVFLLRVRRLVAEGTLAPEDVAIYWIDDGLAQSIRIGADGSLDSWPDGVFSEEYEEIMAMRRAARRRSGAPNANQD